MKGGGTCCNVYVCVREVGEVGGCGMYDYARLDKGVTWYKRLRKRTNTTHSSGAV